MVSPTQLEPGQQLGSYLVERYLDKGGMGVVYLAEDLRHGRKVTIKLVQRDRLANPGVAERFRRESNNQAHVSHPNILPLLDSGQYGEVSYFVTPYQASGNLAALLDRRQLTLPQVAHIVRQVAEALSAAHRAGIIHRDVKPGNILVAHEDDMSVFLADFGLSHRLVDQRLTGSGGIIGTTPYMAPELFAGGPISAAADVFALAVTTHRMTTGRVRCEGACGSGLVALCEVVRRGMARDPGQRHGSASAFAAAVTKAIDTIGHAGPPAAPLATAVRGDPASPPGSEPAVRVKRDAGPDTTIPPDSALLGLGQPDARHHPSGIQPIQPRGLRANLRILVLAVILALAASGGAVTTAISVAGRTEQGAPRVPASRTPSATPSPLPALGATTSDPIPTASGEPPSAIATGPGAPSVTPPAGGQPQRPAPGSVIPTPQPDRSAASGPPPTTASASPPASGSAANLVVCADSVRIRDRPEALDTGAVVLGYLYRGDHFRAYVGPDDHWVRGFAYDLGREGWVERKWLGSRCQG